LVVVVITVVRVGIVLGEVENMEVVCSFAVALGGIVLGDDDDDVLEHPATRIAKTMKVKAMIDILSMF